MSGSPRRVKQKILTPILITLAASVLLYAGACMPQKSEDPNKPLPRKSRAESLTWAKQYTSTMAHYAEVKTGHTFGPFTDFEECIGKNDEVADDGRYTLTYTVYADLPLAAHIPAVRKLRTALEKHADVKITGFQEKDSEVTLYGRHDGENFSLIADTVKPPNTLRLSVSTPCFLPPEAKQQKF
ncbi:hypothetical protein [Streptomyces celluloflavus]|uniref:hypothetical protein n=1 Tax=Streptomyces celluloflavus TaxID=58344 RepID=UPI0036583605